MPYPNPERVIQQLWQPTLQGATPQIYAILDAARNEQIYPTVVDLDGEYCCLYRGDIPQVLAEAVPYLVKLEPEHSFMTWLISEGWGDSWGIFLESDAALEELRGHFRRFTMAKDEDGKQIYFRFYDPRVLRAYLPTSNETELETVFGPVNSFLVEGKDVDTFIEYSHVDSKLNQETIPLL